MLWVSGPGGGGSRGKSCRRRRGPWLSRPRLRADSRVAGLSCLQNVRIQCHARINGNVWHTRSKLGPRPAPKTKPPNPTPCKRGPKPLTSSPAVLPARFAPWYLAMDTRAEAPDESLDLVERAAMLRASASISTCVCVCVCVYVHSIQVLCACVCVHSGRMGEHSCVCRGASAPDQHARIS
jgi:hypothetical protein